MNVSNKDLLAFLVTHYNNLKKSRDQLNAVMQDMWTSLQETDKLLINIEDKDHPALKELVALYDVGVMADDEVPKGRADLMVNKTHKLMELDKIANDTSKSG